MKKQVLIGAVSAGVLVFSVIGSSVSNQLSTPKTVQSTTTSTRAVTPQVKVKPTCDGTNVISGCTVEGISYKTYIYHPAVVEKSHTETETTYQEQVVGHCTLCNDGTRSPSCATGSGTCSHHKGVAQWNAPITISVPISTTKNIVDTPAQAEYYEKVTE